MHDLGIEYEYGKALPSCWDDKGEHGSVPHSPCMAPVYSRYVPYLKPHPVGIALIQLLELAKVRKIFARWLSGIALSQGCSADGIDDQLGNNVGIAVGVRPAVFDVALLIACDLPRDPDRCAPVRDAVPEISV